MSNTYIYIPPFYSLPTHTHINMWLRVSDRDLLQPLTPYSYSTTQQSRFHVQHFDFISNFTE